MKKSLFYLIILIILSFPKSITSQEINPLDFFPHHVGDLWQYFTHRQIESEFWERKITAIDTMWSDSSIIITERIRNSYDIQNKVYLNDSLVVYWESWGGGIWEPRYKFNVPINTFWLSDPFFPFYTKYVNESEDLVFKDTLLYREYWTAPDTFFGLALYTERLAIGIGFYFSEFEVGITVLNGCIINGVQYGTILNVEDLNEVIPPKEYLLNNFPNPFNPQTKIKFYVTERSLIKLKVYDILGNEIKILVDEEKDIGYHEIDFDGSGLPSGIYFYTLQTPKFSQTKKMVLLR